jgi:2-hydroxychromene-2-carboxylate isomerase
MKLFVLAQDGYGATQFATSNSFAWSDQNLFATEMHVELLSNTTFPAMETQTNTSFFGMGWNTSSMVLNSTVSPAMVSWNIASKIDFADHQFFVSMADRDGLTGEEVFQVEGHGRFEQDSSRW